MRVWKNENRQPVDPETGKIIELTAISSQPTAKNETNHIPDVGNMVAKRRSLREMSEQMSNKNFSE